MDTKISAIFHASTQEKIIESYEMEEKPASDVCDSGICCSLPLSGDLTSD